MAKEGCSRYVAKWEVGRSVWELGTSPVHSAREVLNVVPLWRHGWCQPLRLVSSHLKPLANSHLSLGEASTMKITLGPYFHPVQVTLALPLSFQDEDTTLRLPTCVSRGCMGIFFVRERSLLCKLDQLSCQWLVQCPGNVIGLCCMMGWLRTCTHDLKAL